jgi:hypothetical protein
LSAAGAGWPENSRPRQHPPASQPRPAAASWAQPLGVNVDLAPLTPQQRAATLDADLFLAVGSSLQVFPAAGFPVTAKHNRTPPAPIVIVTPPVALKYATRVLPLPVMLSSPPRPSNWLKLPLLVETFSAPARP